MWKPKLNWSLPKMKCFRMCGFLSDILIGIAHSYYACEYRLVCGTSISSLENDELVSVSRRFSILFCICEELVFRFCSLRPHTERDTDTRTFNVYPLYDFPSLACVSPRCSTNGSTTFIRRIYKTLFVFISCANVYIIIANKLISGSAKVKCVEKTSERTSLRTYFFIFFLAQSLFIWLCNILYCVRTILVYYILIHLFSSWVNHYVRIMSTDCIQAIKRSLVMKRCCAACVHTVHQHQYIMRHRRKHEVM